MMSARFVTLSAAVMLGLSLVVPACEAAPKKGGVGMQQAPKASQAPIQNDATSDLRDLVNKVEQNTQSKKSTR